MFIQSEAAISFIIFILAMAGIVMFFYGIFFSWTASEKKEKLFFALIVIVGLLLIVGLLYTTVKIPKGSIGIDQNGNWYSSGEYITLEKIWVVPLKGSVPLWKNAELAYDLTPEEVMSLERGSNFKERLKSETAISIQGMDMKIEKTSEGINTSHLKVLISF